MKLRINELLLLISDQTAKVITDEVDTKFIENKFSAEVTKKAVLQMIDTEQVEKNEKYMLNPVKRKKTKKWVIRIILAAVFILSFSTVIFAVRKKDILRNGGAVEITDENRKLIGTNKGGISEIYNKNGELQAIYDTNGKKIDEAEIREAEIMGAWKYTGIIKSIEEDELQPKSYTKIKVEELSGRWVIPEVMFDNGALIIFTKPDGSGWSLKKGDGIEIELEEYTTELYGTKGQEVGYFLIENGRLNKEIVSKTGLNQEVLLDIELAGVYYPCIMNWSIDITSLKKGKIIIKDGKE